MALVALQTFDGSFPFSLALASLLGTTPLTSLEAKCRELLPSLDGVNEDERKRLWATLLAVVVFEQELASKRDVWELVVEKVRSWMAGLVRMWYTSVEKLEKVVCKLLD